MLGLSIFCLGSCSWSVQKSPAPLVHVLAILPFRASQVWKPVFEHICSTVQLEKKNPAKIQVWCERRLWSPSFRSWEKDSFFSLSLWQKILQERQWRNWRQWCSLVFKCDLNATWTSFIKHIAYEAETSTEPISSTAVSGEWRVAFLIILSA